jgi:hypothetical protein
MPILIKERLAFRSHARLVGFTLAFYPAAFFCHLPAVFHAVLPFAIREPETVYAAAKTFEVRTQVIFKYAVFTALGFAGADRSESMIFTGFKIN